MPRSDIRYKLYPSLLDKYTDYVTSDNSWEKYWGNSENPKYSPQEWHEQKFRDLIDRINRVPLELTAAYRGTAFEEVVNCLVQNRKPKDGFVFDKVRDSWGNVSLIRVTYASSSFYFPLEICRRLATQYSGAVCQNFVRGVIDTRFGDVELYGFTDYTLPFGIHDLKTCGWYERGNYADHAQHLVYPFCLKQMGSPVDYFQYDIVEFKDEEAALFSERYEYVESDAVDELTSDIEDFILFLQDNRELITDRKVFNEDSDPQVINN